jgi:4-hydroxy-tetrahydrodipicolinate reductase
VATVSVYGAGQLGRGVAEILVARGTHTVRGPFGRDERAAALTDGADLVLIATTTRLRDVVDDVRLAVAGGSNVLVSAEESAHPWSVDAEVAEQVHREAVAAGVTVVGAGLNPGLVFDALVLTVLGAAPDDVDITVRRTVDISGFGPTVLARIGVGVRPQEFARAVAAGEILGHAGFPQSMAVVARATGRSVPSIEADLRPLVTERAIGLPDGRAVAAGLTAGVEQTYRAVERGHTWYAATFVGHVAPGSVGLELADVITLHRGDEVVQEVRATPCFPSQSGSQHVLASSVDRVVAAAPGWLTVADLPPASAQGRGPGPTPGWNTNPPRSAGSVTSGTSR